MSLDLTALGPDVAVPFFVFQGEADDYTPFDLAKSYFDSVRAPEKALVAVPGAGHYAFFSHEAALRALLVERVRPLGVKAEASAPPP
jgi:pimeloyl-ACP methyl ester carboxylesterase